jgi:hypothetical protein
MAADDSTTKKNPAKQEMGKSHLLESFQNFHILSKDQGKRNTTHIKYVIKIPVSWKAFIKSHLN